MWRPVASYFIQRDVTVYLVKTQQVADLREYYSKHAKSDRISAEVLVRLPWVDPESLYPLQLVGADYLTGQRWCKQQEELAKLITAVKNRIQACLCRRQTGLGAGLLAGPGGGRRRSVGALDAVLAGGMVRSLATPGR